MGFDHGFSKGKAPTMASGVMRKRAVLTALVMRSLAKTYVPGSAASSLKVPEVVWPWLSVSV
jgi:hypothetical protein